MSINKLTRKILHECAKIANSQDSYMENGNDWCGDATSAVGDFLDSLGIEQSEYQSSFAYDFGGINIDSSHSHNVLLEDGTIIDTTIMQFVTSGNPRQRRLSAEFPTLFNVKTVAVIPLGHPYSKKLEYEAHKHGGGFTTKPNWWPSKRHFRGYEVAKIIENEHPIPLSVLFAKS